MRADRSPVPPDHRECGRCSALVPDTAAACLCRDCLAHLLAVEAMVDQVRRRQRQRLASTGAERYVTPIEAARMLACSPRHVRRLAADGKLPVRRALARMWIPVSAVERMIRPESVAYSEATTRTTLSGAPRLPVSS
ncbi:MAG: helix-turn-helix domain-containing protein [Chloroflexota bacterium]